jgi:2-polyprenyl-6-methoxyphenol hydroxylase and related FAD-dependent oxidoreductases
MPRGGAHFVKKYGQPTLTIHRADLQAALLAQAQALGISIRWGEGWSTERLEGRAPCSALIGADGLWSAVRPLVPEAQAPRPTGQAAIRGLLHICPNPRSEMGREITVWCGHGAHLVGYPLSRESHTGLC